MCTRLSEHNCPVGSIYEHRDTHTRTDAFTHVYEYMNYICIDVYIYNMSQTLNPKP